MEQKVIINSDQCTGCGLCVKDCVGLDIVLKDNKAEAQGKRCILCGHCEAVCPQNAVTVTGFEDSVEEFSNQTRLDPSTLMKAIKTRRSIRDFKNDPIPEEILNQIIEAGRLAPTGGNGQGIQYIVLKKNINKAEETAVTKVRKLVKPCKNLVPLLKDMTIDDHFFFKNAPVAIVVLGKDKVSASIAAQNMAFMAEANGLGVLYSGFFTYAIRLSSKVRKLVNLPKGAKPVTTLVLGFSNVNYKRTVHRKPAKVIEA